MPYVTIDSVAGRTVEQKRKLVKAITQSVVDIFEVKPETVHVIMHEASRENFGNAGVLLSDRVK